MGLPLVPRRDEDDVVTRRPRRGDDGGDSRARLLFLMVSKVVSRSIHVQCLDKGTRQAVEDPRWSLDLSFDDEDVSALLLVTLRGKTKKRCATILVIRVLWCDL